MIAIAPETVVAVFAIFCRIGGCLMIAPGFASTQVPVRVRLFVAVAAALALSPALVPVVRAGLDGTIGSLLVLIFSELAIGLLIGFLARIFFLALQTIGVAITQAIGLGAIPGTAIGDQEQVPALTTLLMVAATTLMFVTGLHGELMRGLFDSYATIPPGTVFAPRLALVDVTDQTTAAFLLAIRIGAPFIVYSVVVNVAIGIVNKLTPQIPVYFISVPFVMAGGLLLLLFTVKQLLELFDSAFAGGLASGWVN